MQLSSLLLSACLLVSSVVSAPAASFGTRSDAELMLKRQFENTNWDSVLLGRDVEELQKRIVYNPKITHPTAQTVWTAGKTYSVTWDTSDIPDVAKDYKGMIKLGFIPEDGQGGLNLKWQLTQGFPIRDGKTSITLPKDLAERHDYIVVVFGDSGNASPKFTIKKAGAAEQGSPAEDSPAEDSPAEDSPADRQLAD